MRLKITAIHNGVGPEEEAVHLVALADCNMGDYLITDNTYLSGHTLSNQAKHAYLFDEWKVKKGDVVVLWTGQTSPSSRPFTSKNGVDVIHHFYWGLKKEIWNNEGDCAVLHEISQSRDFPVPPKK